MLSNKVSRLVQCEMEYLYDVCNIVDEFGGLQSAQMGLFMKPWLQVNVDYYDQSDSS